MRIRSDFPHPFLEHYPLPSLRVPPVVAIFAPFTVFEFSDCLLFHVDTCRKFDPLTPRERAGLSFPLYTEALHRHLDEIAVQFLFQVLLLFT